MSDKKIRELLKILRKLDRPPAGPNWVRFIFEDPNLTAKSILRFARGHPQFSYQSAYQAIRDRIELGIELSCALQAARAGAPAGLEQRRDLVKAFFSYDEVRLFSAANPIGFETEWFRVSREVIVPVSPLSIIRERGVFVPVFLCGWNTNPLTLLQRRLLATIYEDAFLSLTDYQNSPAEVLFFPKAPTAEGMTRQPEVWRRGDYRLLSQAELNKCVETFIEARDIARAVLLEEIENLRREAERNAEHEPMSAVMPTELQEDLFRKK